MQVRMKPRRIYYRKKEKSIVIEGKLPDGKTQYIWTLPDPEKLLSLIIEKASYFDEGKAAKITENIKRLAYRDEKLAESSQGVPLNNLGRTPEKDARTTS